MPRGVPRNRAQAPGVSEAVVQPFTAEPVTPVAEPDPAPVAAVVEAAPVVAEELTAEQRLIAELRNQLALERGRKDGEPELDPLASPGSDENIVIHFLQDGFTANGQIWYRGQELEFEIGSQAYKDTFDRVGQSWLDLRLDEFAQVDRYGEIMFRPGPWPGKTLIDAQVRFEPVKNSDGTAVPAPSAEELAKAHAAEEKRRRAAPRLQAIS